MTQFEEFINAIPHGRYDEFRKRVVTACGVSDGLWRMWKTGTPVKTEENRKAINRIALDMFGKKVFLDKPATTSCPDCPVAKFNACSKGVPCCQCSVENCNARQPCPKEEGKL